METRTRLRPDSRYTGFSFLGRDGGRVLDPTPVSNTSVLRVLSGKGSRGHRNVYETHEPLKGRGLTLGGFQRDVYPLVLYPTVFRFVPGFVHGRGVSATRSRA